MYKRVVSAFFVTLMLVSMFVSSIMVEPVKGDGEFLITIMPDGTIVPDTAPMTRNGNLYLLTENITLGMYDTFCVIQKGNIVIDGNEHEVKNGYGVSVFDFDGNYYCRNVSIRNMIVKNCSSIIDSNGSNGPNYQDYIRGMTLTNNHFTNGSITLWWTDSINISNNTFVASGQSTTLSEWYVSNSVISRNTFADGRYVSLINSPNCAIFENEGSMGIDLNGSPNSTISNNTMVGSDGDSYDAKGITIWNSENVTISGNNVTGFPYGVGVGGSPKCLISENRLSNMKYDGVCLSVGQGCSGTRISGNFLKDSRVGLSFASNCTVTDNVISNNNWAVIIGGAAGWPPIFPHSKIYHNHFINNTIQAHWGVGGLSSYPWNVTTWDDGYPSGGNYWSDYNGTDFNYDGIGDSPCSLKDTTPSGYFYNLYMGRDRFPLMTSPFAPGLTILEAFYNYTISPDYEVTFDGSLSSASSSTIVKYEWDFGDGTTGVGVTVTHKYNSGIGPLYAMSAAVADPTYSATLKVTDDKGSTNQVTRTVAKGNFIAREILPVQAYKVVPSDEFGLVQEKATDFWINCESTFSTPMKTSVRIDLVGFFPDVYEFNYTFTPGSNEFYVGQIIRSSTFFKPWLKPAASFSFTIDPYNLTPETDETDNSPPTGYTQINVTKTDSLRVLFVPVRWKNEDGYPSVFNGYSAVSLREQATESIAYIRATYPVAETGGATGGGINYDISCTNSPVTAKTYITGEELERPTTMDEAKDAFVSIAGQLAARAGYRFDRVVGVVRTDWFVGIPGFSAMEGYSITNNPVASVVTLGNWAITPHEMGHSYGLTDLNYRDDGYYVTGRTEVNDAQTWMSTGAIFDPPVEPKLRRPVPYFWVSDNQFLQLFSAMKDPFDPEILSFNADFWQNGTAKLGNLHRYPAGFPTFNEGNIGNYSLVQLDGSNNVLSTVGFNVTFKGAIEEYPEVTLDRVSIAFTIPYLSGAKTIQMRDQLGNVVASKTVSANSPSIHVTSPNGGEVLKSETTQISWEASDLDGDSLTYNLLVSGDGGATWDPVATDLKQTTHNLIVTGFSGGNKYLVKVVASDGVNTAEDVSDGFFTIASFTASLVSVPQTTQAGNKACYLLNLTSYGGFSDPITLSASSSTTNQLNFTWDGGATVTPFVNGSAYVLLDVETLNQIESGNHTIYLSGTCGNNTEVAVTYLFVETHDLAVINITSSETTVIVGAPAFITVAIQNQGSFGETFDVYLYCNETYLSSQSAYVPAWASINLTFTWDTTGFTEGNYTLTAEVDQVTGEIDTTNNILVLTEQPVTIIPEFPSMLILPAFMLATLVALAICKRKRPDFFRE